jgi:hypothetical protein
LEKLREYLKKLKKWDIELEADINKGSSVQVHDRYNIAALIKNNPLWQLSCYTIFDS